MQRVIDHKLDDIEQGEQIAQHAPNTDRGGFHYTIGTLYRTPDGEYFLYCEGAHQLKTRNRVTEAPGLPVRYSTSSMRKQRWTGAKNAPLTARSSSRNSIT